MLESLRAETKTIHFQTTAMSLAPGLSVEVEPAPDHAGSAVVEGRLLVVGIEHSFRRGAPRLSSRVMAIPLEVPYRLPVVTPRPVIAGVQSAIVSGAAGEEIHTDKSGRIRVHFLWDREQAEDEKCSLPIRVLQPNTPGSMLLPRVGWEVLVAFEDGDPDRPYVLGRSYNGKHPPPVSLPANKTMSALSTISSPGGGATNALHFEDAAGRQHMRWNAGFGKTTQAGNNASTQTVGFEWATVTGNQSWTIGAGETLSVKSEQVIKVGSQTASVGGSQSLMIKATGKTGVGSETVVIGGALLEQVGNPVDGAAHFAEAAVLAGVGQIPVVGTALTKGYSMGKALGKAYAEGGLSGLGQAALQQGVGLVASQIPAGDALSAAADAAGLTPWSDKAREAQGAAEAGGGTGGPGGSGASAAAAAPGHRKTLVDGVMAESIGAAYTVTTPGSIKWSTLGASSFAIGGGHSTRAVKISRLTAGISADTSASISIKTAQAIGRTVSGALKTTIAGALDSDAAGPHFIKSSAGVKIEAGASIDLEGSAVVFVVGGSVIAAHGGGVLIKASTVTINGKVTQSGKTTNAQ